MKAGNIWMLEYSNGVNRTRFHCYTSGIQIPMIHAHQNSANNLSGNRHSSKISRLTVVSTIVFWTLLRYSRLALRLRYSSSIYQFYYLTITWLRTWPSATCLVDKCRVGTLICQSLMHVEWDKPMSMNILKVLCVYDEWSNHVKLNKSFIFC